MVKNTKGGKGAKTMARKSVTGGTVGFPVPTSDMEQLAVVTKIYGPTCDVLLLDGTTILCHIRKKFKGRRKHGNSISIGSVLLIGYRDWESDTARKNCDLLFVYDNMQASSLADRFTIPSIPFASAFSDITFDTNTSIDIQYTTTTTTTTTTDTSFDDL